MCLGFAECAEKFLVTHLRPFQKQEMMIDEHCTFSYIRDKMGLKRARRISMFHYLDYDLYDDGFLVFKTTFTGAGVIA